MRIAYFCFIAASLAALCGMGLGIFMGLNEDFSLAPVHAHINLLGWVTLALYGLYHRGVARKGNRLAWIQVASGALGAPIMTVGLAFFLTTHSPAYGSLVAAGSILTVLGMLLFLVVLVADLRRSNPTAAGTAG